MALLNDEHYLLICFSFSPIIMNLLNEVKQSCLTYLYILVICCCSVSQSWLTLWHHGLSTPGLSVLHHLPKFAQAHIHCISDAIQLSHHLTLPSPSAFRLSQHKGPFQWVTCSDQMTKILELQLQHQSFQWVLRVDFPEDWLVRSCCPSDFENSSPVPQFEDISSFFSFFLKTSVL